MLPQDSPLLSLSEISIGFPRRDRFHTVVHGVSFSLFPGRTTALVGESGSGKSVTALSIPRLHSAKVASGTMTWFGGPSPLRLDQACEEDIRALRGKHIGVVFQEPMSSLNPLLTIGDQLAEVATLHLSLRTREARHVCAAALERVGISGARANAYPHELSGGMRQRAMIAMALLAGPRLLIADEPTTALDATVQRQILDLLGELRREQGLSLLLVTHDMGVVAQIADDVCVMNGGRILERGPARTLLTDPTHPYTRGLLRSVPVLGQRVARLSTVADILGDPRENARFRERTGHSPFWRSGSSHPDQEGPGGWRLVQVRGSHPDHWVGASCDLTTTPADTSA